MVSLGLLLASHLCLATSTTVPLYAIGIALWGLHMGFSQGLLSAMVADAAPQQARGSAFGTFNLITGLVVLIGNTAAGGLWHEVGQAAPFVAGAALSLLTLIVVWRRR